MFTTNIKTETLDNENYRKVLHTTSHMQLVVMSLKPNEEIGMETHDYIDQFIRVESGSGIAIVDDIEYNLSDDISIIIPAGANHNIINTSKTEKLKLYTIYSPPNHKRNTIQSTKPIEQDGGSKTNKQLRDISLDMSLFD